jgi:5-methylcytosine-specific restriction protein A
MAPTIRIDDDVYSWLQDRAEPFIDTPNAVLRRIAGLDGGPADKHGLTEALSSTRYKKGTSEMLTDSPKPNKRRPVQLTGKRLNQEWEVGAQHALYHRDGCWYNNLERFPGALFDPDGYILFETEDEYQASLDLNIGKETNVPNGISAILGYVRVDRSKDEER